jgi:sugar lactone lactonase YvrE
MTEAKLRYPDPAVRVLDRAFEKYRNPLAAVECIAEGGRWLEGPVWFGDGRYLLWSDIPNDRILRWSEQSRQVEVFRQSANHANGNTRDRQGRLITCEHGSRRVTRTEYDGSVTVLADSYRGKRLNSPNDVVVTPDGFRVDVDGNLWCGWGMGSAELDGVRVFTAAGQPIGHISLPERCANLCFGGLRRNRLFMASSTSVYSLYVNTQGAAGG